MTDETPPMVYRRCGRSGLKLPTLSLGLWHNFGETTPLETCRALVRTAFDGGITHFDLANNYGPPAGSAEETFHRILQKDLAPHRDEIVVATKAGYEMWTGPYGNWGSRKSLVASLDQSLKRLGLDYVDVFYHHRPDPETPLEESMGALDTAVRSGKALYVGISNYPAAIASEAIRILRSLGTPCLIHQARYSMLDRWVESELLAELEREGVGMIAFSPLAKGVLTDRYLHGIPTDSRAAVDPRFLKPSDLTEPLLAKVRALNELAAERGQTLAQMALAWVVRDPRVTSVLVGASQPGQLRDNLRVLNSAAFTAEERSAIDAVLAS